MAWQFPTTFFCEGHPPAVVCVFFQLVGANTMANRCALLLLLTCCSAVAVELWGVSALSSAPFTWSNDTAAGAYDWETTLLASLLQSSVRRLLPALTWACSHSRLMLSPHCECPPPLPSPGCCVI